jgi:hypothetical protein
MSWSRTGTRLSIAFVAHDMLMDHDLAAAGDWLGRVEWRELVDDLVTQLKIARAAIIYLLIGPWRPVPTTIR